MQRSFGIGSTVRVALLQMFCSFHRLVSDSENLGRSHLWTSAESLFRWRHLDWDPRLQSNRCSKHYPNLEPRPRGLSVSEHRVLVKPSGPILNPWLLQLLHSSAFCFEAPSSPSRGGGFQEHKAESCRKHCEAVLQRACSRKISLGVFGLDRLASSSTSCSISVCCFREADSLDALLAPGRRICRPPEPEEATSASTTTVVHEQVLHKVSRLSYERCPRKAFPSWG